MRRLALALLHRPQNKKTRLKQKIDLAAKTRKRESKRIVKNTHLYINNRDRLLSPGYITTSLLLGYFFSVYKSETAREQVVYCFQIIGTFFRFTNLSGRKKSAQSGRPFRCFLSNAYSITQTSNAFFNVV